MENLINKLISIAILTVSISSLANDGLNIESNTEIPEPIILDDEAFDKAYGETLLDVSSEKVELQALDDNQKQSMDSFIESMNSRQQHARELLGKHYKKNVKKAEDKVIRDFIKKTVNQSLKKDHKKYTAKITKALIREAKKHELDPLFLLAVIQTESMFNPYAIGGVGEIGLMQIRPETAEWICKKTGIKWKGPQSLRNPDVNIQIGAAFFNQLRKQFDSHSRLYISAYNMGATKVRRMVASTNQMPKEYASKVMKNYLALYEDLSN